MDTAEREPRHRLHGRSCRRPRCARVQPSCSVLTPRCCPPPADAPTGRYSRRRPSGVGNRKLVRCLARVAAVHHLLAQGSLGTDGPRNAGHSAGFHRVCFGDVARGGPARANQDPQPITDETGYPKIATVSQVRFTHRSGRAQDRRPSSRTAKTAADAMGTGGPTDLDDDRFGAGSHCPGALCGQEQK